MLKDRLYSGDPPHSELYFSKISSISPGLSLLYPSNSFSAIWGLSLLLSHIRAINEACKVTSEYALTFTYIHILYWSLTQMHIRTYIHTYIHTHMHAQTHAHFHTCTLPTGHQHKHVPVGRRFEALERHGVEYGSCNVHRKKEFPLKDSRIVRCDWIELNWIELDWMRWDGMS